MHRVSDIESAQTIAERSPVPLSELDFAITAQFIVAWAGESGEERRLGWWRSDLVSEFGGQDLFRRLLPNTWNWAVLQGAREAARRRDTELRRQDHDPDRMVSLFALGFEVDERIEERLQDLKRSGREPRSALPGLSMLEPGWNVSNFYDWVSAHGSEHPSITPVGRWLKGEVPIPLDQQMRRLVAALAPPSEAYPLPHFRRSR